MPLTTKRYLKSELPEDENTSTAHPGQVPERTGRSSAAGHSREKLRQMVAHFHPLARSVPAPVFPMISQMQGWQTAGER